MKKFTLLLAILAVSSLVYATDSNTSTIKGCPLQKDCNKSKKCSEKPKACPEKPKCCLEKDSNTTK
jgi:hypothetical protein